MLTSSPGSLSEYSAGILVLALRDTAHYVSVWKRGEPRMTTPLTDDKRKGKQRIARRLPVRFGTEAKMCGGTVIDISEGGMKIESAESFPINSILTVFVQFPRHSIRLRARIMWAGAASGGGAGVMGLALTQPEPTLKRAYSEWTAEVKLAATETNVVAAVSAAARAAAGAPVTGGSPAETPVAPVPAGTFKAAPPAPEPRGPIRRRLESRQGESYEALLERTGEGWQLTIIRLPRQLGVDKPDLQDICTTYADAEKALRDFVRSH
jgi:hypothetical protein